MGEEYFGSREEDMDAEGQILKEEQTQCANCLKRAETTEIKGVRLCTGCSKQWPDGMPF